MTADRSVMERRLQAAFGESPSMAGAAMLDGRISAAIAAGARPRGASAGSMGRRRTPWMLPAAAVVALAVAGGGGLAWLSGRSAVPGPGSTAPVGAVLPSPSGEPSRQSSSLPSVSPSPTPVRIIITPPPPSPEPLPVMDARAVVEAFERRAPGTWWSPGRLLDPVVPMDGRLHGAVRFRVNPPRGVAIEITPLEGALVQVGSTVAKGEGADPLGCAPGSVGRYQVAASDERLDLRVVDDACPARVDAVGGTWQAGLRSDHPTVLVPWDGRQLNDAVRIDARTTGFAGTGPSLLPDGREGEPVSAIPVRAFGFHHPDGTVFLGRPVRAEMGACLLGPDPLQDVPLQTAEEALADLEARPGVRVVGTRQIEGDGVRLLRVDVAAVDEPDACGRRILFASPPLGDDSIPLWQIPKPQPGEASAPVYLATVSDPDGESMAIALVEKRLEPDADLDAIATQVFGMIDWQPELHPPAWPAAERGAPVSSPAAVPSPVPSPTPERIVITPPPASPMPLPVMDAHEVVKLLTYSRGATSGWWWSPGRTLSRVGRRIDQTDDIVALRPASPANAQVVLEPRSDGTVRVTSRNAVGGDDPFGCVPRSSGRYRIAATDERLDLEVVTDPCAARAAAVTGTWQGASRMWRPTVLFSFLGNPQVEALRLDLAAAGVPGRSVAYVVDDRAQQDGEEVLRGVWIRRPDAEILVAVPPRSTVGACALDADRANDAPLRTVEEALEDLRARPGLEVTAVTDLTVGAFPLHRVDIAAVDEPDACAGRALFAAAPDPVRDDLPLWQVPTPTAGEDSAPIYLATVPGRDGNTTVVALLVEPSVEGVDRDAVAAQVFDAIDWEPGLHPPAWPAE